MFKAVFQILKQLLIQFLFIQISEVGQVSQFMNNKTQDYLSPPRAQQTVKVSPGKQPQAVPQKVLSGLFTKQFLINVKNQLNKTKSPKYKQPITFNEITDINHYKVQIQNLKAKLRELSRQNEELKQKLFEISQNGNHSPNVDKLQYEETQTSTYRNKLKIRSEISLYISGRQYQDEIQKLRQKVQNLEMYKVIKEKRFEQLLQKSARYQSQIMLLKVKEEDLQEEVKSLRETIRIHVTDMNGKPLRNTNISDHSSGSSVYGQNGIKLPFEKQQVNEMLKYMLNLNKRYEDCLQVSHCNQVYVPDDMHISKMALKHTLNKVQSFNQIDYLISEELPYLQVSEELQMNMKYGNKDYKKLQKIPDLGASIKQSQIFIELDSPCAKKEGRKELQQSLIKIQLNNHQIPEVPSIMQQSQEIGKDKLNQSIVEINLNDF